MKMFRAVVEDNNDPEKLGRVRARIIGIHTADNENSSSTFNHIKTTDLPWAEIMGDTAFGLISGVGQSSVLRKGTWVWVVLDHDNPNKPIVIGTVIGKCSTKTSYANGKGFCDPDGVYPKRESRSDLHPILDTKYPNVAVLETESGILIELDDSVGDVRVKVTHPSGSYINIDNAGNITMNSVNNVNIIAANDISMFAGNNILGSAVNVMKYTSNEMELYANLSYQKDIYGYGEKFTWAGGAAYNSETWTTGSVVTGIPDHGLTQPEIPSSI